MGIEPTPHVKSKPMAGEEERCSEYGRRPSCVNHNKQREDPFLELISEVGHQGASESKLAETSSEVNSLPWNHCSRENCAPA